MTVCFGEGVDRLLRDDCDSADEPPGHDPVSWQAENIREMLGALGPTNPMPEDEIVWQLSTMSGIDHGMMRRWTADALNEMVATGEVVETVDGAGEACYALACQLEER